MSYSIWLEPIEEDSEYLKNIIVKLSNEFDSPIFEPHITLDSVKKIPPSIKMIDVLSNISKIVIFCDKMKYSDYFWKTLFIEMKKNDELDKFKIILKNELDIDTDYEFEPHISLIYKKLENEKKKNIISKINIKSKFTFDKISIIMSSDKVEDWTKIFTYKLKN